MNEWNHSFECDFFLEFICRDLIKLSLRETSDKIISFFERMTDNGKIIGISFNDRLKYTFYSTNRNFGEEKLEPILINGISSFILESL